MKKYIVTLEPEERELLQQLIRKGKAAARKLTRARILLKADSSAGQPGWTDEQIAQALDIHYTTVANVRRRWVEQGLEAALNRRPPTRQYERKLDGEAEAHLIALACSGPPEGHQRWTLRLLADKMVELRYVDSVSHETVRQTLKKTSSSRG
jgi:transposase